jgi:ketosteroid isomerase-like protein
MSVHEVAKKLVQFCKENKSLESINTLYSPDIVSIEAGAPPGKERVTRGIEGVRGKHAWWTENHIVHSAEVQGPYPHGDDKFAVRFTYDITLKAANKRFTMDEIAVFEVKDDKVVKEEFFYQMG